MNNETKRLAQRTFWTRMGYGFTAIWVVFILYKTDGNMEDPWFDGIFLVPLAVWAIGLFIARIVSRRSLPENPEL